MPESPTLEQSLHDALEPIFGPNLELYYAELERHDAALRDISRRFVSGVQFAFLRAFNRAVADGHGEEAGFAVHAQVNDYREGQDEAIRVARDEELSLHRANVEVLKAKREG